MKLRLFAATLAVMPLGTTSIMAEGLQKTPDTPFIYCGISEGFRIYFARTIQILCY